MVEYWTWHKVRTRIQIQLVNDFQQHSPDPDLICDWIEDFQIFAMALQHIGERIQTEADDVTDLFHTWLTD